MGTLKAGTASAMDDNMAKMIEDAMIEEWGIAYPGRSLSSAGALDRRIMFAAVAKGVLRYLHKHQHAIVTVTPVGGVVEEHSHKLSFDLVEKQGEPDP
jgi:hypothetical protein